jgi:biopolymer transport protein ExbD
MSLKAFDDLTEELSKPEISMAPLIDMVFLLLIFFAVTTNFIKESGIKVDKAPAATTQPLQKDLMVVSIDTDGQYWYDGSIRSLDFVIESAVAESERNPRLNIVMVPDRKSEVEPLVKLMDRLRGKNISRFSIGTQFHNRP